MPDDDLRTALAELADDWTGTGSGTADVISREMRRLLDAHPAPVVPDPRREDVARALCEHRYRNDGIPAPWHELPESHRKSYLGQADAVLAVLPAPPVVDEAALRERIAQDIEAAASTDLALGLYEAVDIARGATR